MTADQRQQAILRNSITELARKLALAHVPSLADEILPPVRRRDRKSAARFVVPKAWIVGTFRWRAWRGEVFKPQNGTTAVTRDGHIIRLEESFGRWHHVETDTGMNSGLDDVVNQQLELILRRLGELAVRHDLDAVHDQTATGHPTVTIHKRGELFDGRRGTVATDSIRSSTRITASNCSSAMTVVGDRQHPADH